MSDTSRVQRWREAKRQNGLQAVTVWLTTSEELRLKDAAVQERCSPSDVMQRAFAQYQARTLSSSSTVPDTSLIHVLIQDALAQWRPPVPPSISNDTDTIQLRQLIREELAAMQETHIPVTDTCNGSVTVTALETRGEETALADTAAREPVTDTGNGNVPDTQTTGEAEQGGEEGTLIDRVRAFAASRPSFTCPELTTALGTTPKAANQALKTWGERGQVRKEGTRKTAVYSWVGASTPA